MEIEISFLSLFFSHARFAQKHTEKNTMKVTSFQGNSTNKRVRSGRMEIQGLVLWSSINGNIRSLNVRAGIFEIIKIYSAVLQAFI